MKASTSAPLVSRKIDMFAESAIRDMSLLADSIGAINLAQGSPDFAAPVPVKRAGAKAIMDDNNQYEMTIGSPELRGAIAAKMKRFNRVEADPDENVTVVCGSTEGIAVSMIALTDPGDRVIIPEPFYESYIPSTIISGAKAVHFRMREPDFRLAEEDLKQAFSTRPKAILLNTPNNPTGRVLSKAELRMIADLCEDYNVIAITDEIYEYIVYDGNRHISLASIGDMHERTVTISGMSKTFSITGWRIGYVVAEKRLMHAIRTIHDYSTVCAPTPLQKAATVALALPESYYQSLARTYDKKRMFLLRALEELGFDCPRPEGAYYIFADFKELSKLDDYKFAEHMARDVGVAVVPGSSFYAGREGGRTKVRFTFTKKDETLKEAVDRMREKPA
ncbi:MAG: aminotransferase class I/II-fold pyridoxal phosphate-dependent enzyme [Thaumarchaeota archaeon]|nr:aminotransferase class I/II-fold pyridoxal phosphate-dependent enzyme [Nitrososphaerota archaeon]